jgi:hypothetical protein
MNITLEQQLELADKVYPGHIWLLGQAYERPYRTHTRAEEKQGIHSPIYFDPKLDGTNREQAQALQVILAAISLPNFMSLTKTEARDKFCIETYDEDNEPLFDFGPGILTAAALAILEARQ